MSTAVTANQC